ncbi:hypothetical protein T12_9089 [Trichinella patagoniensis]|uniref:Uncharacterized protein n=1 Tax=Trichinella patagoniensis TaxID=990121 RepID=A0A0V0YQS2_9BILA|nr:hypothetical protein T12_9089 [Trichinella patagoniensis]
MEEKNNAFINASAHCGTMDGSDARCQRDQLDQIT